MRYRMLVEYDGTDYHGWQIQPNKPTVQETIEEALGTVLRRPTSLIGSGRTDAGVHARGQVAHFDSEQSIDTYRIKGSLNGVLPAAIGVQDIAQTHETFHARYDARLRSYRYYVCASKSPLSRAYRHLIKPVPDFEVMNRAAKALLGEHDFSTFCRAKSETKNRICNIQRAEWINEQFPGHWVFEISANRFLHGMVRAIVGTLLEVGHGRRDPSKLKDCLAAGDRTSAGPAAPAHGLVLESVRYDV